MQVKNDIFKGHLKKNFGLCHKSFILTFVMSGNNVFEACVSEFKFKSVYNWYNLKITL